MSKQVKLSKGLAESAQNIYQELNSRHVATMGTVERTTNAPQLTVVFYKIDTDFVISFATKKDTKKHQNLQKNNAVQLLVYDEKLQLTIQVSGEAYEIEDDKQKTAVVENMYTHSNSNDYSSPPISKLYAGDYVAYKILPKTISMAFYLRPQKGIYDMFETLTF